MSEDKHELDCPYHRDSKKQCAPDYICGCPTSPQSPTPSDAKAGRYSMERTGKSGIFDCFDIHTEDRFFASIQTHSGREQTIIDALNKTELDVEWCKTQYNKVENENETLLKRIEELEGELKELNRQIEVARENKHGSSGLCCSLREQEKAAKEVAFAELQSLQSSHNALEQTNETLLKRIEELEGENKRLKEDLCEVCGDSRGSHHMGGHEHTFTTGADKLLDEEQARWQDAIYAVLVNRVGDDKLDGKGCDSGDPLDFTLAEIQQAFGVKDDAANGEVTRLKAELQSLQSSHNEAVKAVEALKKIASDEKEFCYHAKFAQSILDALLDTKTKGKEV
jgi:uncharacterized protein (UPF0335 family)